MRAHELKEILTTFADKAADMDLERGTLVVQIRGELIEAKLKMLSGSLQIEENGASMPAESWIINRIARLQTLADCILEQIPQNTTFISPSGMELARLEQAPTDQLITVDDALDCVRASLNVRPGGTTSIVYLTSDAGEGKTTLINHLARQQALAYKNKTSDWLLVPISLGGRTFLRFDDVVIGALVNRLRFQLLYFDAFLELVRMGTIVPALDGFEEMFVETASGDAISALGNLIQTLKESGTVLIAARKAYFEYKSLESQARLYDALGKSAVSFSKISLDRWRKRQFVDYCAKTKVDNGDQLYDQAVSILGIDHPVLTRAVLVRQLLLVLADQKDRSVLLTRLATEPNKFFDQFVRAIIEREANEKWLDKSGDAARPLLSSDEHLDLLADIAKEMWINETEIISKDVLDIVSELFCERLSKTPAVTRQVLERVRQHCFLVSADTRGNGVKFDHEEFQNYSLGYAIAKSLGASDWTEVRSLLRSRPLPDLAIDVIVQRLILAGVDFNESIFQLISFCKSESRGSSIRENVGSIAARFLANRAHSPIVIEEVIMPSDALYEKGLKDISFRNCYFLPSRFGGAKIENCTFESCEFERLDLIENRNFKAVSFKNCRIHCISLGEDEGAIYDPTVIGRALSGSGISLEGSRKSSTKSGGSARVDSQLALAQRAFRTFLRCTEVNENVFRLRLGERCNDFFDNILPRLIDAKLIKKIDYHGSGSQSRYRLVVPLQRIHEALEKCQGRFDQFVKMAAT